MKNKETIEKALLYQDRLAESPDTCRVLAKLYAEHRPLSARAYAMKARRLGGTGVAVSPNYAAEKVEADPYGAFLLGQELCYLERYDEAYSYLEAAGKSADLSIAPTAALFIADLLSHHLPGEKALIREWYDRAAILGNPDVISGGREAREHECSLFPFAV